MSIVHQDTTFKVLSVTERTDQSGSVYTVEGPTLVFDQGNETELILVSDVADTMDLVPGNTYTLTIEDEPGMATGTLEVTGVAPVSVLQNAAYEVASVVVAVTEMRSGDTFIRINHGSSPSPFPDVFDMDATYKITIG